MIRRSVQLTAIAVAVVVQASAGCARDAERVERTVNEPIDATIGTPFELNGVEVNVFDVSSFPRTPAKEDSIQSFPIVAVSMRVQNRATLLNQDCMADNDDDAAATAACTDPRDTFVPALSLWCDEADTGGEIWAGGTIEPSGFLPLGVVGVGRVLLGLPASPDDSRVPVEKCTNPRVVISHRDDVERAESSAVLKIDDSVIAESIAAPEGPTRPLRIRTE